MRPRKSSRLTPRTPRILIVPAGRHEGAGPRNVSWIICGHGRENVILTWSCPCTRLVLAREAGAAARARDAGPAAAPVGGADVEAAPGGEPAPDDVPPVGVVPTAGGVEGTLVTGRGGVGGTETVGAGAVGTGRLGVETVGTETVGTGIVGAGKVGAVTVGRSTAGFAAPSACAATRPRAGRAIATRATRQRISPSTRTPTD